MDSKAYRAEKGITARDMIRVVKTQYPKYGAPVQSMVDNPEKYGICLLPSAERLIVSHYGKPSQGLLKSPPRPKRTRPARMVVYLKSEDYEAVRRLMEKRGYPTNQALLEALITNWLTAERILADKPKEETKHDDA